MLRTTATMIAIASITQMISISDNPSTSAVSMIAVATTMTTMPMKIRLKKPGLLSPASPRKRTMISRRTMPECTAILLAT